MFIYNDKVLPNKIVKPKSEVQVQSPKVKTKRTWADTKITWATHPPTTTTHNF